MFLFFDNKNGHRDLMSRDRDFFDAQLLEDHQGRALAKPVHRGPEVSRLLCRREGRTASTRLDAAGAFRGQPVEPLAGVISPFEIAASETLAGSGLPLQHQPRQQAAQVGRATVRRRQNKAAKKDSRQRPSVEKPKSLVVREEDGILSVRQNLGGFKPVSWFRNRPRIYAAGQLKPAPDRPRRANKFARMAVVECHCGGSFRFPWQWYARKGLRTPKRCPKCRKAARQGREAKAKKPAPQFRNCRNCGEEFVPREKWHDLCSACAKARKAEKAGRPPRDKSLPCKDCGGKFVFSVGEQRFFAEKGLSEPKRCPKCRKARQGREAKPKPAKKAKLAKVGEGKRR